jgi:hypothetical protein
MVRSMSLPWWTWYFAAGAVVIGYTLARKRRDERHAARDRTLRKEKYDYLVNVRGRANLTDEETDWVWQYEDLPGYLGIH